MSVVYGYVRVSTKEQNIDRQMIALKEFGVKRENVFIDKCSGKDFDRPEYKKLLLRLKRGDTVVIKSIDRIGRNYEEIIDQWRIISKEKETSIVVLDMPLLDTKQRGEGITGAFIADLVLQILSYVAQTEREMNRQRQKEGIAAAKARGVVFGRPKLRQPEEFTALKEAWLNKEISARKASEKLGISYKTFISWAKR